MIVESASSIQKVDSEDSIVARQQHAANFFDSIGPVQTDCASQQLFDHLSAWPGNVVGTGGQPLAADLAGKGVTTTSGAPALVTRMLGQYPFKQCRSRPALAVR